MATIRRHNMKHNYLIRTLFCALVLQTTSSWAQSPDGHQQHDAHQHGSARLMIATEGSGLLLEFSSPAINLVGFEYKPRDQKQRDAITQSMSTLKSATKLFTLPEDSACSISSMQVDTPLKPRHDEHHANRHNEHQDQAHNTHGHDEDTTTSHADFSAQYYYQCANPSALNHLSVNLFKAFSGLHKISVQVISDKGQKAQQLNPQQTLIHF